jgi:hypothetical protein
MTAVVGDRLAHLGERMGGRGHLGRLGGSGPTRGQPRAVKPADECGFPDIVFGGCIDEASGHMTKVGEVK